MTRLIWVLWLTALAAVATAQTPADTLRVMTYNLRFGELASMEELAAYIRSEQPDIVALQEVDWKTARARAPRQNGVAMINELAYHTGMFGLYGKAIDYAGGYYGIGILSRYPVVASQRLLLPNPEPFKEQRVMLEAQIELPGGRPVTFVCTHLEVSTEEKRIAQIRYILERLSACEGPVFLAGDFNARPDSKLIREEMAGWVNATDESYTFHTDNPTIKIDYIYYQPGRGAQLLRTHRGASRLSDHFPLITDFTIDR